MASAAVLATSLTLVRKTCSACADCEIRTQAVCAAMAESELGHLERIMSPTLLQPNQSLFRQGDARSKIYTLTSGMVRLFTDLPDGRRQIAGFLLPGDYLGLADDEVYSQSAEAVVTSKLCAFSSRDMDRLMATFPSLKDRLHLMTKAALRRARDNQLVLGRLTPLEKLASFLLMFETRMRRDFQSGPLHLMMSRGDIADHLGLTIETVSRSFTKLKGQGLIRLPESHLVEILHHDRLGELAGFAVPAPQQRLAAH